MKSMYLFVFLTRSKSETDRVIQLRPRGIAPLGAHFSQLMYVYGENFIFNNNNKKTIKFWSV